MDVLGGFDKQLTDRQKTVWIHAIRLMGLISYSERGRKEGKRVRTGEQSTLMVLTSFASFCSLLKNSGDAWLSPE